MLPKLTHLQAFILSCLDKTRWGSDLRELLASSQEIRQSGPSFYQMMGRLEKAGYVIGSYRRVDYPDQSTTKQRCYRITKHGLEHLQRAINFYAQLKIE